MAAFNSLIAKELSGKVFKNKRLAEFAPFARARCVDAKHPGCQKRVACSCQSFPQIPRTIKQSRDDHAFCWLTKSLAKPGQIIRKVNMQPNRHRISKMQGSMARLLLDRASSCVGITFPGPLA